VQEQEGVLLQIVAHYAPKFEADIMPIINLLPILIGAYEMLYLKADTIPEKVSINEAVELAKKFSDDGAREMVNGVLNKLKDDK
jgi:N utilization substance protein B